MRTYFIPDETGTYTFYVEHDDYFGISFDGGETWDNDWNTWGTQDQNPDHAGIHGHWNACHAFQIDLIKDQKYPVLVFVPVLVEFHVALNELRSLDPYFK